MIARMANHIKPVSRLGVVRAAFLNKWVAVVTAVFTAVGILDFLDVHVMPNIPALKPFWDRYYVLPHFHWYTWVVLTVIAVFLASLEGAYRFARDYYEASLRID